ncbi:tat (twin-arginine translocation) pathway signal sequence domain protein, partial [Vibrio parahaemolyticus AQ3810]
LCLLRLLMLAAKAF